MPLDETECPENIGPCRILSRLGEGATGTVYKAHHPDLDLHVAVKLLHPHLTTRQAAADRFLREARLAARLSHPAIIRVFDCGIDAGNHYIVMELADGQTVQDLIQARGKVPVGRSLEIVDEIVRALTEALRLVGLIHRDIKPENILLTSSGGVKLADLGLAKADSQQEAVARTNPGVALGTPRYMAPEQFADARSVDHRADIFSLGATLYHMLAGKAPFDGDSVLSIMKQVMESPPGALPSHVPKRVDSLVQKMLAKDAEDRFQSYSELIEALADARKTMGDTVAFHDTHGHDLGLSMIPEIKTQGRLPRPASPAENRVLLVVDIQNDFCPQGALAVPDGDQIVRTINKLASRFAHVILTQDWHRSDHLSFASSHPGKKEREVIDLPYGSQVLWPDHCIQGTPGANFHPELDLPHCELVVRKGYHREIDSYSAFFENDRTTPTGLAGYLRERGLAQLFIVGLATDFCVAYSALDARMLGFDVTVIESACRGLDVNGSLVAAWEQMAKAGVIRA